jgi:hypothetical protein
MKMPLFDVLYTINASYVRGITADSREEAEKILREMSANELRNAFHLETEDPLVLEVAEVEDANIQS